MLQKIKAQHFLVVTAVMAVVLQIQITLFENGDYRGLRIGLGDLFLPFLGIFILFSLLSKKTQWPEWLSTRKIFWICSLILVMSASLLNGYIVQGQLSHWALVNKYIGFFALLSYFILGNWVATNVANQQNIYRVFMRYFVGFYVLIVISTMITFLLQIVAPFSLYLPRYPWDGLMANRNAFMVLFVFVYVFIIHCYSAQDHVISKWISSLFWISMPMFFIFNESRTGWIAAGVLACVFLLRQPLQRLKTVLPLCLVGVLIAYSSYFLVTQETEYVLEGRQLDFLIELAQSPDDVDYIGDQKRYIAVEDGLEMYAQYNPLVGAGLGSYQPFQIAKRGEFIEVIDFTALLLLVETGAVGLAVFAAFFFYCAWLLYCYGYRQKEPSYFHRAMFVFLLAFAAMSVLHEIMYTRVLWFAMGLALVTPKVKEA